MFDPPERVLNLDNRVPPMNAVNDVVVAFEQAGMPLSQIEVQEAVYPGIHTDRASIVFEKGEPCMS